VGRVARGKAREYNICLKQGTQQRLGYINKRGTNIVYTNKHTHTHTQTNTNTQTHTHTHTHTHVFQHCNQDCSLASAFYFQLHPFQQTNASREEGGWKLENRLQQANYHEDFPSTRARNHRFKVLKVVLLNQATAGHWCTARFSVEKWLGDLYSKKSRCVN